MSKILLWDIDGTVLNFTAAERVAIRKGFRVFRLGECTDEMLENYAAINKVYWEKLERGEMSKHDILEGRFDTFFTSEGIPHSPELVTAFNDAYQIDLGDTIVFYDHADELIRSLKGKVRQYAVTNGTRQAQTKKMRLSGLGEVLDGVFISEDIGIEKPARGYFDAVFSRIRDDIGYEPAKEDYMIIGDSLTSDMKGGIDAGITTVWYNPKGIPAPVGMQINYTIQDLHEVLELLDW